MWVYWLQKVRIFTLLFLKLYITEFFLISYDPWFFGLDWTKKEIKMNKKAKNEEISIAIALNLPSKSEGLAKIFSKKEKENVRCSAFK